MVTEGGRTYTEMSSDPFIMQASHESNDEFSSIVSPGLFMGYPEEDALMMETPFLDFVDQMLMDEAMEDRIFSPQDCIAYQAIFNGFQNIIGRHAASVHGGEALPPSRSASKSGNASIHEDSTPSHSSLNSVYDMIDERSASWQSSSPGENIYGVFHEQSMPSFSTEMPSTSTSDSCSSHELIRIESPDIVNGFHDIISEHSAFIQSPANNTGHFNAFTNISGRSNELVRLESHESRAPNTEHGWINDVLNSIPATPVIAAHHDNSSDGRFSSTAKKDINSGQVSVVKNRDLDVEADYERLYVDIDDRHRYDGKKNNGLVEDSRYYGQASSGGLNGSADGRPCNRYTDSNGKKGRSAKGASGKHKSKRNGNSESCVSLDLKELLVSCAQAVAVGDWRRADDILQQLRQSGASPYGNGLHRTLHYFCKALEARMNGTGSSLYNDIAYKDRPSSADLLKAFKAAFSKVPYYKIAHYFANQSILKAAEGATHLHIIDYGIFYGLQWPCLINALADRKGGPPKLIITGVEFPGPGLNPAEGLEDIGRRLAEYAKAYKVPFEYQAIAASNWEDVNPISEDPCYGRQVLVVNCMNRLKHVLDESVNTSSSSTSSQRQKLLNTMCSFKPDLFVVAVVNANHNSPFFITRFRDALNYYSSKYDIMHTTWGDCPERMIVERDCMYRDMLNVVACEGVARVERPENYKQWQARIQRAGFEKVPFMPSVLSRSKSHLQSYYDKDFTVDHDSNHWMLVSWKGRTTEAMSVWKPRAA